ncbi:OmpA family protein [Chachezhania antarctica]|uniref:OmpA family protein n=1 Tax=Chachezhania antarctica TaxID=2340860 RepID=UPI000EAB88A1|nr:OmpA family protein [Chachezhania antarctica]|tara:strand:+ start:2089 stop:2784 length:696 start_codon:yes stop_codon:yes gene_type:complete
MTQPVAGARRQFRPVRIVLPALAGVALLTSACTDPASLTTDSTPNQNRNQGAIAGGVLGAGVGAILGGNAKTAALGAAVGTIAGAAIGEGMDRQAAELRNQLSSDGISIVQNGDRMTVTLPHDITFATDSFAVRPELRQDLTKVAASLNKYPNSNVQIIGHTDNTGDATYNIGLSQQRAEAVANLLIVDGVSTTRLRTIAAGESNPIASNLTPEGQAQNRRVEIVVTSTEG